MKLKLLDIFADRYIFYIFMSIFLIGQRWKWLQERIFQAKML